MALTEENEENVRALAHKLRCSIEVKDRRWRLRKYNQCFVGRVSKLTSLCCRLRLLSITYQTFFQE